ncbi:MAG TPA: AsmA-like C-terminal region-containing protein [Verrucomicrobiae bacterium]|nr:AsmA-like C-terminal region-containing protein [Verrucomicrobiae bacterium]
MKIRLKLLTILVIAVIAAAALIQTFNVIAGKNRELVRQELQKVLGRDFNFTTLEVTLLSRPGFSVKMVRIADDTRFAATPIIQAKELILGVSLWNLLLGRIVIDTLTFDEPELQIIINESGLMNLTALAARKKELRTFPRLRSATSERQADPVSFSINALRVKNGRVEYLDRSIPVPAELQVKNINLSVQGLDPTEVTRIRLVAALTEGLNQDVKIDGEIAPQADRIWSQRPIDLAIRFDSLHLPVIARAIASLRDRLPRAFEVTGPMALQAKASGTFERPRIDDFTLKMPLFGSSDYNATATGSIVFSEKRSWATAQLQGRLKITSMEFDRLRNLPFLQKLLSPAVIAEGPVEFFSRFEGSWNTLRIGALLVADKGEVRFRDWLRKPAKLPAEIRVRVSRQKEKLRLHPSEVIVGASKLTFTGDVDIDSAPRLRLELTAAQSALTGWNQFFPAAFFLALSGRADGLLVVRRGLYANDADWGLQGQLKLTDGQFRPRYGDRRIDDVNATIIFTGKQARFDGATFRVGASKFALSGITPDLLQPAVDYQLRSDRVNAADLPALVAGSPFQLLDVNGKGRIRFEAGRAVLSSSFAASNGHFQWLDFRDFRTDVVWSAAGLAFSNLSAKLFDGTIRADGRWTPLDETSRKLHVSWQADAIDVRPLVGQLMPSLKARLEGRLNGRARFDATNDERDKRRSTINGAGETSIERGVIKDFNLFRQVLLRGSGAASSAEASSRLPSGFVTLINQLDTPFDSIKANFIVEDRRIRTDNLVMTMADYTITGAGWVGMDRSTKWDAALVLAPRLAQEIQKDYRVLRYMLDRRNRLSISFRVDGTVPNIKIRLESRILAQLLRGTAPSRDSGADEPAGESTNKRKNWLPDALERFLKR